MRRSLSFDVFQGGVGDDLFPVSPARLESKESNSDLSMLFAFLEDAPSIGDTLAASPSAVDVSMTPSAGDMADDALLGEEGTTSSFLEGFTNLQDFLFSNEATMEAPSVLMSIPEVTTTTTPTPVTLPSRKRPAPTSGVNRDHDDYVAKKPRKAASSARLLSDSVKLTEQLTPLPSTSSVGEATSTTTTPAAIKKDEKYRERRIKNNIASKRSRETRKQKFSAMELRAVELEEANAALEKKAVELEQLTKKMKEVLVQRLSQTH